MEKWIKIHNRNAWVGFIAALPDLACVYVGVCTCVRTCVLAPLRMCEFAVIVGVFFCTEVKERKCDRHRECGCLKGFGQWMDERERERVKKGWRWRRVVVCFAFLSV